MAEFERDLIRERTKAGMKSAKARGRVGGRPSAMTPGKLDQARRMYEQENMTAQEVADVLGVSRATILNAGGTR